MTRKFGGQKTLNTIPKAPRCWSHKNKNLCCFGFNTYVRNIKYISTHILYEVVCRDCDNVQKLAINKYKCNNFLKVI